MVSAARRAKNPKSLSGIETICTRPVAVNGGSAKNPKSLSGIETDTDTLTKLNAYGAKNPKSLSGIETKIRNSAIGTLLVRAKNPKSLSGIETYSVQTGERLFVRAKNPKSLSGIETQAFAVFDALLEDSGAKNPKSLSGIETLLQGFPRCRRSQCQKPQIPFRD